MFNGIVPVDKPRGMTSHDVVAAIRRMTGMQAVGHTGTLDPESSGLLLCCLGFATKFARFFECLDKKYWTVLCLGACTNTQDASGSILQQYPIPPLSYQDIIAVLARFIGDIQQTPPMYSAIKYRGKPLYHLARQGQVVPRQGRTIVVNYLRLLEFRKPWLTLSLCCSKGTYVRTLGEDIGLALGCGAYMVHLQRCQIGPFQLRQAFSLDALQQHCDDKTFSQVVIPITQALDFLPSFVLSKKQYYELRDRKKQALHGIVQMISPDLLTDSCYRLCTPDNHMIAIMQRQVSDEWQLIGLKYLLKSSEIHCQELDCPHNLC